MLHKAYCGLSLISVAVAASLAAGQTMNINFDVGYTTAPSPSYAAAGAPGFWNGVDGINGVPEVLFRVEGTPLAATITLLDGAGGPAQRVDDPSTTNHNDEALLDDFVSAGTDVVGRIRFDNLATDTYEVIVYAWKPLSPNVFTSIWPDCDFTGEPFLVGGVYGGQLEEGVTHARFTTTVTGGTLEICTTGGLTWEGALNGIQLAGTDCVYDGPSLCTLPPDPGPCDGICWAYFHNPCTGQCEEFMFGCCPANANNFETLPECEAACPSDWPPCVAAGPAHPDPLTPDVGHGTKSRYVSFEVHEVGVQMAIQVTFKTLPPEFAYAEGRSMWAQEPFEVTEGSGSDGPWPYPTFLAAVLGCTPYYTDWSALEDSEGIRTVNIYDDAIVPSAVYEVRLIDETCDAQDGDSYSPPLTVATSDPGDLVGNCEVCPCTPPNGVTDFVDISTIVEKFANRPGPCLDNTWSIVRKPRADLINSYVTDPRPDLKVDFVDVGYAIEAFRGQPPALPGPPVVDPCAEP